MTIYTHKIGLTQ